ncbi:transglutaminase domain-containing protein [uncultured Polaribacter sp.]|uniref:transglutaminase domain-containing protein n=1 Tax=uncultured Polaribacter sp. TaxID=174711 RepID=UPI0030DCFF5B
MGQTTLDELKMTVYDNDSSATAVVLYEHANYYPDINNDEIPRTDYYFRIKILDKTAFDLANISINTYKKQRVTDISAITYNITEIGTKDTDQLLEKDIFSIEESENWTTTKFALPNIKEGAVIEYKYSVISPYLSINDWNFQTDIPKIKSEFDASILGNYQYNIKLVGSLKLDKDEPSADKKCVYIDGIGEGGCAIYSYGMNNIPAFKEEEYMLSKKNYISRITFDLKSHTSYRGVVENLTTTWKQADKSLKDQFFNNQTSKKRFFEKNIPEVILNTENTLEKAKKIYQFIQNHYTWNEKYWTNEDAKVKEAFQEKTGDVGEINISLYNSLMSADIEANLVVLSTRDNGIPTKVFPIIYDYNYVIVKIIIDEKSYFLDATNKFLPFGQVPLRTLNGEARVINFKEEGYWEVLKPNINSAKGIIAKLNLNEDGVLEGELNIRSLGYEASNKREKINLLSKESYLEGFEGDNPDVEVDEYNVQFKNEIEKPLQEFFKIKMFLNDELTKKIRINPFFFERLKENPFKLKERNFPVDFGYPRKNNFALSLTVPDNYNIVQAPETIAMSLPNNGGLFILKSEVIKNKITLYVKFNINKQIYSSDDYFVLKEFFKQIVIAENSVIILEKKA